MNFASDNAVGAAPEILEALAAANDGALPSYGSDPIMARVEDRLAEIFECGLRAFLVGTGTAANALALASMSPPWGTVFCHRNAHIAEDECGAPQFYGGGLTLALIDGAYGLIPPEALHREMTVCGARGVHQTQPAALSLTNVTENGALYSPAEIAALTAVAREFGCPTHLDGTRFANAVIASGASPAELSWKAGVDVLCLGATKNGVLAAEAVIFFNPAQNAARISEFEFRRKRGGHLVSKGRLLSAQMDAYLADGLWLRLARQSNDAATKLAEGLAALEGCTILNRADANMIFVRIPALTHQALRRAGAAYYLEPAHQDEATAEGHVEIRLVTSPFTTPESVEAFLDVCRAGAAQQ